MGNSQKAQVKKANQSPSVSKMEEDSRRSLVLEQNMSSEEGPKRDVRLNIQLSDL